MKCLSTLKNKILATTESCSMGTSLNSYYLAEKKIEKAVSNGKASNASSCDIERLSAVGRKAFVVSEAMYRRPSQEH